MWSNIDCLVLEDTTEIPSKEFTSHFLSLNKSDNLLSHVKCYYSLSAQNRRYFKPPQMRIKVKEVECSWFGGKSIWFVHKHSIRTHVTPEMILESLWNVRLFNECRAFSFKNVAIQKFAQDPSYHLPSSYLDRCSSLQCLVPLKETLNESITNQVDPFWSVPNCIELWIWCLSNQFWIWHISSNSLLYQW